jgi:hypothetical protein
MQGAAARKTPRKAATGRQPARRAAAPRRKARKPTPLAGAGIAALAILAALLPLTGLMAPGAARAWTGFLVLLARQGSTASDRMEALPSSLGPGVVSESIATAEIWDFEGMDRVPFSRLAERLDPSDPRSDAFIIGAGGYFHAAAHGHALDLAYLPATTSPPVAFVRTALALGLPTRGEWRLLEFDLVEKALSTASLIGVALLYGLRPGRRRGELPLTVAAAALWLPFVLWGDLSCLAASLLLFSAWHPLMREWLPQKAGKGHAVKVSKPLLVRYVTVAVAACAVLAASHRFTLYAAAGCIAAAAAALAALPAAALLAGMSLRPSRRRTKFEPVPIVGAHRAAHREPARAALASIAVLVLAGCLPVLNGTRIPTPRFIAGAPDFGWASLSTAARTRAAQALPGYPELVAHAAFQETIGAGRPWRLPVQDERVYVRGYLIPPGSGAIQARQRTVKVFDTEWLLGLTGRAPAGGLETLLAAQGRPVLAVARPEARLLVPQAPPALLALAAFAAMLAAGRGAGPLIPGAHPRLNRRAKRNRVP